LSPDGRLLTFTSNRDGNNEIYAIAVDGTGLTRLTESPESDVDPAWSPDGTRLAFTSDRDGEAKIYLVSTESLPGG
jgi:TolB protein